MTRGQRRRLGAFVAVAPLTLPSRPDLSPEAAGEHSETGRADDREQEESLPAVSRASHHS
jgi:hypothetical protein